MQKLTANISTLQFWQGAFWQLIACACFATINGIVRYLGGGGNFSHEVPLAGNMMVFFQNLFGILCLFPLLTKRSHPHDLLPKRFFLSHLLRIFSGVAGVCLWYLTLKQMPIAMGLALTFTGPVFTVIGARLLLQEEIGIKRYLAIFLSVCGAFIISRPDRAFSGAENALGFKIFLPLGSALGFALNKLLTRQLASRGEQPEALAGHLLLLMTPVSLILALPDWQTPQLSHLPWLMLLGGLAALAHVSFGRAYAKAEVVLLMPFGFSKFLFSMMIGYFCFFEEPTANLWIGLVIICLSIWLVANRAFKPKLVEV